jgi:hypothetical protein
MTITKKHLNELADIVHKAQAQAPEVAGEIKSFAKRHAPNFDESRWNDYMHKLKKADELRS